MGLQIEWSEEAIVTFNNIIDHLQSNWTEREIRRFVKQTEDILATIVAQPLAHQASKSLSIRRVVITKHNTLYYKVTKSKIYLLTFWDNRQNPKKLKY